MKPPALHLYYPALADLAAVDPAAPRLPALETWLCRGRARPWPAASDGLLALFQQPATTALAELSRRYDLPTSGPGHWLRADPVHLYPDRARLRLFDAAVLSPSQAEADALVAELNAFFAAEGLCFHAPTPSRWYLKLPAEHADIGTYPLHRVRGADIAAYLPYGPAASYWHARLNEAQMLLHRSPVNAAREHAGMPTLNSVWPWGGGTEPLSPAHPPWRRVWHCADPLAGGLALSAGVAEGPLPADAEALLASAWEGAALVVLPPAEATEAAQTLERAWVAPLLRALREGALEALYLYPGNARSYALSRADARRWWRGRRPWQDVVKPEE